MAHPELTIALCGDVMTGRGIDQILPHPVAPQLFESYAGSALDYVTLAESANGAIPRPAADCYIWGDASVELQEAAPDAFVINLETSITDSGSAEPKGINYRMSPANIGCLKAVKIDCCVLANNHVMDWGADGFVETLETLRDNGLKWAGAGMTAKEAAAPAIIDLGERGRLLVFAMGSPTSGVPFRWAARSDRPGVNLVAEFSDDSVDRIAGLVSAHKRPGDVALASIHWGDNWGYDIARDQQRFAHALIDRAGIDVVHGHSSHHPKAAEVYAGKLILYGCGDFIDDYEGIGGYESYRSDLVLLYELRLKRETGRLRDLTLVPFRMKQFRLQRPSAAERAWLHERLSREYGRFGLSLTSREGRFLGGWR
jgi:poly-gamma-glutamate capsule biosynthesis protein CapA/YwtB (metallophosphatase superfamily)